MSVFEELPSRPLSWWFARCARSRKLSRWLLPTRIRRLRAVAEYCSDRGGETETWLPRCGFVNASPIVAVGDADVMFGGRPDDAAHPPVTRRMLRGVRLYGLSNLIHVADQVLHGDMVRIASDRLPEEYQRGVRVDASSRIIHWPSIPVRAPRIAEAVSLLDATAPNYAHWLSEILPKAALWTRFAGRPDIPLLVDAGLHANIMRALDLVVHQDQRIILVPRGQAVDVDVLHHVSAPGHIPFEPRAPDGLQRSHGTFSAEALRMTTDAVKSALRLSDSDPQAALVLVRRNSAIRKVLNEREVEALAARLGWATVAPETLAFDDQVRLFHRAGMVVAPTGAALANLLFARPGCRVGVMMSTHPATPYFYWHNLARTCGVTIEYILCRPEAGYPHGVHSHFEAPVADMARFYGPEGVRAVA